MVKLNEDFFEVTTRAPIFWKSQRGREDFFHITHAHEDFLEVITAEPHPVRMQRMQHLKSPGKAQK